MAAKSRKPLPYETPELSPVPGPLLGRPPAASRRSVPMPDIAGHRVADLVARFGSPLCVIDEDVLRRAYRRLLAAFRAGWERTRIGYSVKTNYLSAIVAVFRSEGALGEVVSGFEYEVCRDLGIPGEEIIFNGPWKSDDELRRAFHEGAMVNLDGDDELGRAIRIARGLDGRVGVGLRVNVRLNYPPWDKFGFSLENGHALEAARLIAREPNLRLDGLHLHVGTYIPDPAFYGHGIEGLIGLALRAERELGAEIRYLDVGGGYATRNTLHGTMLPGQAVAAAPEDYAEAITTPLRMAAGQFTAPPMLYLEPGRGIVDEAVTMIGTVRAVKRISGQQKAAVLDVGVHILPTAFWYNHEICPAVDRGAALENYRLVGPLCMQIDVVRESIDLPSLTAGDHLVIRDVGAYNFSQSMQFIYLRPNYVLVHGREATPVRRRETVADVRASEALPAHLVNQETAGSMLVRNAPPAPAPAPAAKPKARRPAAP